MSDERKPNPDWRLEFHEACADYLLYSAKVARVLRHRIAAGFVDTKGQTPERVEEVFLEDCRGNLSSFWLDIVPDDVVEGIRELKFMIMRFQYCDAVEIKSGSRWPFEAKLVALLDQEPENELKRRLLAQNPLVTGIYPDWEGEIPKFSKKAKPPKPSHF